MEVQNRGAGREGNHRVREGFQEPGFVDPSRIFRSLIRYDMAREENPSVRFGHSFEAEV